MSSNENTFLRLIVYAPLIFVPLFVTILTYVFVESYNKSFEKNVAAIKENIYKLQNNALKTKVDNTSDIITYKQSVIERNLENRVKNRVLQAYKIATAIYETNKKTKSELEIKQDIVTALKAFLWNDGESFIWIVDYDGVFQLAPDYLKHLTRTSILNFQDATGRYVIQEEIEICKKYGEGFLWDTFTKPNENTNKQYKQVAFVKALNHFNWYLGSSEYLDTATKHSNKQVLKTLENIDVLDNDYLFLIDTEGNMLLNKTVPKYIGKNIKDIDDSLIKISIKKMLSSMEKKDSDYVTYKWLNMETKMIEDKHSYIKKIPNSNWIVGSGFYASEVLKNIQEEKLNRNGEILNSKTLFYISFFTIFIAFLVAYFISRKLKESYSDYKNIISKRTIELEELNATLEKKVEARTQKLQEMSVKDVLTGLFNRKYYNEKIEEHLSLYKRYSTSFSMIMFDIDDFKYINDVYGHKTGDKVLVEMSKLIQSIIRKNDLLFRVGGEEFIVIVPNLYLEKSLSIAKKIRNSISEHEILEGIYITLSVGVTEVHENDTEDTIFQRVDGLLYYSKMNGKNMVSTKTVGDVCYSYFFDDETSTLYERINGRYMNIKAFRDTLMDEKYMIKYLGCKNIITDFTDFEMNFEHYQHDVLELFRSYQSFYLKHHEIHLKNKKSASYIHKFDNVDTVEPFRELQRHFDVETQNFKDISDISEFIGHDVRKYFEMDKSELTPCK